MRDSAGLRAGQAPSESLSTAKMPRTAKRIAGSGWRTQSTNSARSAPASSMTAITNHSASGTSASAVTRWAHQCSTPSLAEPSPIARLNGERMRGVAISSAPIGDAGDPGDDGQRCRPRDHCPAAGIDALQLEPAPGIPPQMPQPVAQMVEQRNAPAEQQNPADPRAEKCLDP